MALLKTVPMEKAEGVIKTAYEMFMKNVGMIPKPLEMMSVSPALFESQLGRVHYYSNHPALSFSLLAHIRYLAAKTLDYPFCTDFNKMVLKRQGLEEEDFKKMEADPSQSLLEEKDSTMLAFVINCLKNPGEDKTAQFQELKNLGWTQGDIFDALSQGVSMIDHSIMMQVFRMDQNCMIG